MILGQLRMGARQTKNAPLDIGRVGVPVQVTGSIAEGDQKGHKYTCFARGAL